MVKKEIDIKKKPTEEQQKMLREMEETSIIYDDECPELTEEEEVTTDITVTKIWDDNNDKDGNRPKSITVHLFAGGEEVREATLTEATGWKWRSTM